ncbi:hypothetical protein ACQB60_10895 [Actinomycetota bacterium Odt1-20B]
MTIQRTASRRAAVGVLVALLAGTSAACSTADSTGARAHQQSGSEESATATRGLITKVVTVDATVRARATAELTSPDAGTVTAVSAQGVRLRPDGEGAERTVEVPSGARLDRHLVAVGDRVPANYPLASVKVKSFALVAPLDKASLYRLYTSPLSAKGQITKGPGPFDCPLANRVPTSAATGDGEAEAVCLVPSDLKVYAGMPAVMALRTKTVKDAVLLPVEAVAGTAEKGRVTVLGKDGKTQERPVKLGVSDGTRVQVVSGVREGERVRVPGPDLVSGAAG